MRRVEHDHIIKNKAGMQIGPLSVQMPNLDLDSQRSADLRRQIIAVIIDAGEQPELQYAGNRQQRSQQQARGNAEPPSEPPIRP